MPPLKGNLPNGFASCALRMAILREAVNSRIKLAVSARGLLRC